MLESKIARALNLYSLFVLTALRMDSLERLAFDFKNQISSLGRISATKESENVIYIGSGDSYVAGLIAEYFSGHTCKCYSPSDLIRCRIRPDRTYYFISVTGKTRTNIEIAKLATKAGAKTVAITLNPSSELAQVCKETIPLQITSTDTITSYSTFTANVVTCLKLTGVTIPRKFETWHRNGTMLASDLGSVKLPLSVLHILGNNILYPIAVYASLKMAEFFGVTATANKLEEFCHSPIFGAKPFHSIWIFGHDEEIIGKKINKLNSQFHYFEFKNSKLLSQLFQSIFFLQSFMLLLSKEHNLKELKYLQMKKVLKISSDIIYKGTF